MEPPGDGPPIVVGTVRRAARHRADRYRREHVPVAHRAHRFVALVVLGALASACRGGGGDASSTTRSSGSSTSTTASDSSTTSSPSSSTSVPATTSTTTGAPPPTAPCGPAA